MFHKVTSCALLDEVSGNTKVTRAVAVRLEDQVADVPGTVVSRWRHGALGSAV
jgi:hypothetical protein